jgi:hypothetical protein
MRRVVVFEHLTLDGTGGRAALRLVDANASPTGVVIATNHQERG